MISLIEEKSSAFNSDMLVSASAVIKCSFESESVLSASSSMFFSSFSSLISDSDSGSLDVDFASLTLSVVSFSTVSVLLLSFASAVS